MKEATFITFDGTTKVCSIPDDITLDYKCLITTIRKELSVQDDYRIKIFREGIEDALNPSSDFQSGDKYFVLFQQFNKEKTDELIYVITSRHGILRDLRFEYESTDDAFKLTVYTRIEELINEGAQIESLYVTVDNIRLSGDIQWLMSYIIDFYDFKLLKLLLNTGLDINSPLFIGCFTDDDYIMDDMTNILLLYKCDLRFHYDLKSTYAICNLGYNHRLIAHAISENILSMNTLLPPNNTAFFYYINKLDEFLDKYKYPIDYNLTNHEGGTFISYVALYHSDAEFEKRLTKYSQININLQYNLIKKHNFIEKHKHTKPGDTLLHMLCRQEKLNLVKIQLLLDRDVKLIRNDDGETQLDVLNKQPDTPLRYNILQILEKYFNVPSEIK